MVFIFYCLSSTSSLFNQYVSALKYKYNHINVSVNDFLKISWINKSDLENCADPNIIMQYTALKPHKSNLH